MQRMIMLLKNSLVTPDGTEIVSRHRHDFVSHLDKNGKTYFVDGGSEYMRRSNNGDEQVTSVFWTLDVPHAVVRELLKWGSRKGKGIEFISLKDLSTDHIKAILETQHSISNFYRGAMHTELAYREELGI